MTSLHVLHAAVLGVMLAASAGVRADAAMPTACSMLSLAGVRAIVGAPVAAPSCSPPSSRNSESEG